MRHHDNKRKFGRKVDQRKALLDSLASNLFKNKKITTTLARAKELRPFAEKMITAQGKAGDRKGGHLRIVKSAKIRGDGAKMAIVEFV